MDEFETTDTVVDIESDESNDSNSKVAPIALAGALLGAAVVYGVVRYCRLRNRQTEVIAEDVIIELPESPDSTE